MKREKTINQTSNTAINDLSVFPISDEECYRYLRLEEILLTMVPVAKYVLIKNITDE